MTSIKEQKYKDRAPYTTIHNIRSKLVEVGILTTESNWLHTLDGFYSVTLSVDGTTVRTNGKGTTKAYALASAYGELMERLQNLAPFRLSMDFDEGVFSGNFYYAPDEKSFSMDELLQFDNEWLAWQLSHTPTHTQEITTILHAWRQISYEDIPTDFIAVPYKNISHHTQSYIPIKMANKMYMSNGMCAGNTRAEACIQGICEIMERYVNQKIIRERITPPTIPDDFLNQYPAIMKMIKSIEVEGHHRVIVKDCSLGKGYPVTCVIFIDLRTAEYFIKFGSSPIFEISLERTLTELLQGQHINKMKGLKDFQVTLPVKSEDDNIMNILVNGSGYYPREIFMHTPSYTWDGFHGFSGESNEEILEQLVSFIEDLGYSLLIRDVSFLDFPAYHMIIPGLSEVESFYHESSIQDYATYNTIKKQIRRLKSLTSEEIRDLIYLITNSTYHPMAQVVTLLGLKLKQPTPWYFNNMALLLVALYLKINDYDHAHKIFNEFLEYTKKSHGSKQMLTYYKCVSSYLELRAKTMDKMAIFMLLTTFYPIKIVQNVIKTFENTEDIFHDLNGLQCFNCHECYLRTVCMYSGNRDLLLKLMSLYQTHDADQQVK
ncbi:YcaO-like family protein [Vallitalea pronyensis]|uniref:YcaO-like family protein n=1 Tax=Vallitalea pronyensis TaxID=1348613 RepID=A0A8J8ML80_9FIRM|nr:YcaO-like family protein [Vallitalea pronyensis]QUI23574.1 YcaO-like family protein [Vallitalea pronyensis]